tara:strand:+ start:74 stop:271 length:198 start_codon:yes stop_codon:yes gene_type:complete
MNNTHENTATDPSHQQLVVAQLTPPHQTVLPAGSSRWPFAKSGKVHITDRIPEGIGNIPFWDFKA